MISGDNGYDYDVLTRRKNFDEKHNLKILLRMMIFSR